MSTSLERLLREDLPVGKPDPGYAPVTARDAARNRALLARELAEHERAVREMGKQPRESGHRAPAVVLPAPRVEVCVLCGHPMFRHVFLVTSSVSDDAPCPDCPDGMCRAQGTAPIGPNLKAALLKDLASRGTGGQPVLTEDNDNREAS